MGRAAGLLILGGTTEAAALARALAGRPDLDVVTSLAGRTANPRHPVGRLRVGGFGGASGLAAHLRAEGVAAVVDATHPFAAVMRWHAAEACAATGTPRLRLERPPWHPVEGDRWLPVATLAEAATALVASGANRVLLTTGRSDLASFVPAVDGRRWWLVRSIDRPASQPLQPGQVVLARGPFTVEGETDLMVRHRIDVLVTKNSGGSAAVAKLAAARALGVPVVVVDRPPSPEGPEEATVAGALRWLDVALGRPHPSP